MHPCGFERTIWVRRSRDWVRRNHGSLRGLILICARSEGLSLAPSNRFRIGECHGDDSNLVLSSSMTFHGFNRHVQFLQQGPFLPKNTVALPTKLVHSAYAPIIACSNRYDAFLFVGSLVTESKAGASSGRHTGSQVMTCICPMRYCS